MASQIMVTKRLSVAGQPVEPAMSARARPRREVVPIKTAEFPAETIVSDELLITLAER